MPGLIDFIRESNRIEGIHREPTVAEVEAHAAFLNTSAACLEVATLTGFVGVVAPGKLLREKKGMNVYVGNHVTPPGGPDIPDRLIEVLTSAAEGHNAYEVHQAYESLHPFMDGNGRSGRALWLWQQRHFFNFDQAIALGFLHCWYYASLSNHRK